MSALPRLMLVTDRRRTRGRELVDLVEAAVDGGVGIVQVREAALRDDELRELVARLQERLGGRATLVVNGSLRVARTRRTGLHLPAAAAPIGGDGPGVRPYGRSVHDEPELLAALGEAVDYVVAGSVFETRSKPGRPPAGLGLVERVVRLASPLPVYAIGGVTISRVPALLHAGAHGVAVCGAILEAGDPRRIAAALRLALDVAAGTGGAMAQPRRGSGRPSAQSGGKIQS